MYYIGPICVRINNLQHNPNSVMGYCNCTEQSQTQQTELNLKFIQTRNLGVFLGGGRGMCIPAAQAYDTRYKQESAETTNFDNQ